MKLVVSLSLVLNVFSDDLFVGILSYGVEIESGGPEVPSPEHPLHFRMFLEDFPGGDAFYLSCHRRGHHGRDSLDQKVDMVFVGADFHEVNLETLADFQTNRFQGLGYRFGQGFAAVLDRKHRVVQD